MTLCLTPFLVHDHAHDHALDIVPGNSSVDVHSRIVTALPITLRDRITCPTCQSKPIATSDGMSCPNCGGSYPTVKGVPILLPRDESVFSPEAVGRLHEFVFSRGNGSKLQTILRRILPTNATNLFAWEALRAMGAKVRRDPTERPSILVLGAGDGGEGLEVLLEDDQLDVVQSDVVLGPHVSIVLDSHAIPFENETFDAVVAQAVLEHVLDPVQCVREIWRVLRPNGLVYVETPFMQQVHGGRYDFTRYTFLGHRRLLRCFDELDSGIVAGPGAGLSWAWEYFLMSFCRSTRGRWAARATGRMTSFFFKYFDHMLASRPGAFDAASAFGFLGSKADGVAIDDATLLDSYRGLIP